MINDYFDDRNGVDAINTPSKVTTFALCPCHLHTCHASFKTMRCLFTAALTEECRYTRDHAVFSCGILLPAMIAACTFVSL